MEKKFLITSNVFSGFTILMLVFFIFGIVAYQSLDTMVEDIGYQRAYDTCRYIDLVLCIVICIGCFVPNIFMMLKSNHVNKGRMLIKVASGVNFSLCTVVFCLVWAATFSNFWINLANCILLLFVFSLSISMTIKMHKTNQLIACI